ncbi:restriction endonuclease subunit S [Listeria monocytogenes]|nr:restriction endonuclease subunit S [Listeria monocytogenes]EAK9243439.1 restriction endonuclease subunit S [Listeria monocytogenes]PDD74365.1 restriction endonuclease subunit S [Listeria monocytogenes]HAB7538404.1 restriction endonuclease subunit S [Listeria monocytogenes]HAB7965440.1 restriction endonuclease subunit S [Listeria monocytogenes]
MPLFYVISHYFNLPFRAWEQRKLEELAAFSKGSGYTKNDLVEKGMPLVLYGRLYTKYETIITEVNTFTKMKDKSVISKGNEVVVPSSGETAKDISRASVIGAEGFILGGDLNIIKPKRELNSIFLALTISNGEQQKEIIKRAQGKSVVHVYNTDLKQVKLSYPTFNEQEKIGSFFRQLDNAIALHQRKLDTLKRMKKGFLQQMFPNNEEEIPNVRFTDFDAMWEQRKLKSITEKITRKNKELESTLPLTISAQDGLIDQNEYFNKIVASRNIRGYFLVKNGEFAYNKSYSKGYPWGVVKRLDNYDMGVLSTLYIIFKPIKINSDFLTKYFDSTYWYRAVSQFATEGARNHGLLNIAASDFFEIELNIPLNNEEQKKIGLFFQQLENILILHQNKLEKLSILKKTYLKKCLFKN